MKRIVLYTIMPLTGMLILSGSGCKKEKCISQLKPDCICTMQYDPVCGCDGKTYGNACEAQCNSITEYTKGECK